MEFEFFLFFFPLRGRDRKKFYEKFAPFFPRLFVKICVFTRFFGKIRIFSTILWWNWHFLYEWLTKLTILATISRDSRYLLCPIFRAEDRHLYQKSILILEVWHLEVLFWWIHMWYYNNGNHVIQEQQWAHLLTVCITWCNINTVNKISSCIK